ncbi:FAD-dependent oxidoreductase [Brevibacterium litoralis]|uniref:FAD-dependent oxidoreductase n=1 Tax=Brevibacterium litoralis TaxID=3138935 RepID=UPI0032F043AA
MELIDLTPRLVPHDPLADLPVAVIGAGPIGLTAAVHLRERGLDALVLEKGDEPASALREWGHVRLFSPWEHLVDPVVETALAATDWSRPTDSYEPLGSEFVRDYVEPLAALPSLDGVVRYGTEVLAVTREGKDRTRTTARSQAPFVLRVRSADGHVEELRARAVLDASGTWGQPAPLGSHGLDPLGAEEVADRLLPGLPDVLGVDRDRVAGTHVTVVGAGHSAANTLIALAALAEEEPDTRVTWLLRNANAARVSTGDDELEGRGALGSRLEQLVADGRVEVVDSFEIARLEDLPGGGVRAHGVPGAGRLGVGEGGGSACCGTDSAADCGDGAGAPVHDTDLLVAATGFRPDLSILSEVRTAVDEIVQAPVRLAPLIDPNEHSCGTVAPHGYRELSHPEPGLYVVGMKSYGRAPTFLLKTGYEQVRSVVAWIAGDTEAAAHVELELPETGVCNVDAGGCC